MNTQIIQDKINKKKQEIEILEKELKEKNTSEWLDVSDVIPNCEVELNVHDKGKSWDDLGLKNKENELLTVEQCIVLANSKYAVQLKMDGSSSNDDFFIKQPFNRNREKGFVADFCCGRGRSDFDSYGNSWVACDFRGVRMCRKVKSKKKK